MIDLTNLDYMDTAARDLIARMQKRGARLVTVSSMMINLTAKATSNPDDLDTRRGWAVISCLN